jgi:hypothetical protein
MHLGLDDEANEARKDMREVKEPHRFLVPKAASVCVHFCTSKASKLSTSSSISMVKDSSESKKVRSLYSSEYSRLSHGTLISPPTTPTDFSSLVLEAAICYTSAYVSMRQHTSAYALLLVTRQAFQALCSKLQSGGDSVAK